MFEAIQFYLFKHHHCIDAAPDEQRHESTWVNRAWSPSKERSR